MTAATMAVDDGFTREDLRSFGKAWWLFLVTGVIWLFVGFGILSFDLTSVTLIGLGFAVILFLAAIAETVVAATMEGWRWLHGILAAVFFLGGIFAVVYPGQTFRTLAILIGWFLLIKGTVTVVLSMMAHGLPFWWLALIAGILEIAVGFWAIGYPGRSAVLLVVWAGFAAVFRGITDFVTAFQIRHIKKELA